MSKPFSIGQGNTPKIVDTLSDESGPVNLTGMTVKFILQGEGGVNFTRTGGIEDAASGKVNYQFVAEDSATPGDYLAQWQLTIGPVTRTFPSEGYLAFKVRPGLPFTSPGSLSRLSDFYDDIRAVTGDHKSRRYEDSALARVMTVNLRGGRVPGYALGSDGRSLTPVMPDTDVSAYLLLVYHTAKMLLLPNVKASSYRTRAVSERFGDQRDFLVDIEQVLFQVENGGQTYTNVRGVRSWVYSLCGLTDESRLLFPTDWLCGDTIFI